jgi:2-hydroxy-6-oxonona-2,4-dienedioate hydrolase
MLQVLKMGETDMDQAFTEQATSRYAQTSRWKIHYHELGAGYPLIMLHGGGPGASGWSNFQDNARVLSKQFRVILPDVPGYGKSDEFDPAIDDVPKAQAESIKLLMDTLQIEKAALVGNSMGSVISLNLAVEHTERVSHIIAMGAAVGGLGLPMALSPSGPTAGMQVLVETYRNPTTENFRRLCEVMVFDSSYVTEQLLEERSRSARDNPRHLQNFLKRAELGKMTPKKSEATELAAALPAIRIPTMIMHGRDDRIVPLEASLRVLSVLPNSQLMIFNRCGHWAQIEHAAVFNAVMAAFVNLENVASTELRKGFGG